MKTYFKFIKVLVFTLIPYSVSAQNIVSNADFDSDLVGWSILSSGVAHESASGSPMNGSADLSSITFGFQALDQCITVSPTGPFDFAARMATVSGAIVATVSVFSANTTDCSSTSASYQLDGSVTSTIVPGTPAGVAWVEKTLSGITFPAGTSSLLVSIQVQNTGGGASEVRFDHVRLGPTGTVPVSLQSFDIN